MNSHHENCHLEKFSPPNFCGSGGIVPFYPLTQTRHPPPPVADLHSKILDVRRRLGVQILSISCSFWEILAKSYVSAPLGSWRPLPGEILDPPLPSQDQTPPRDQTPSGPDSRCEQVARHV